MIADLVRRQVSVLAANTPADLMAKAATSTIPIVFTTGTDPVQFGLVASLNRPGGNVTGVTLLTEDVAPKRIELIHELIPTASVIGLLVNPRNPNVGHLTRASQAAAAKLGLQLHIVEASSEAELNVAVTTFLQKKPSALVISANSFLNSLNEPIIKLAARYKLPVVYHERDSVTGGGLISYGASLTDTYHLAGIYVGRILKGDKPADLPVQQATKVELVINLKTAGTLGLTVPLSLLVPSLRGRLRFLNVGSAALSLRLNRRLRRLTALLASANNALKLAGVPSKGRAHLVSIVLKTPKRMAVATDAFNKFRLLCGCSTKVKETVRPSTTKSGTPASATVGRSGKAAKRSAE